MKWGMRVSAYPSTKHPKAPCLTPVPVRPANKIMMGNSLIMPRTTTPCMAAVVSAPLRIHPPIESGNTSIITPAPVVITGAIPVTSIGTPPPSIPEKKIDAYIRRDIHARGFWQHNHCRRRFDYNRRWKADSNTHGHTSH